ncbi:serine aminopeptidase domain-containing protein [Deinococcus peraridilitoris]|uniref:Serine aminopeptidase S33 domain-containing protein n=1 Tax=Deinococcus peraridilitoris (strain DSM 19664 / LMG 22246 / CIP 109416 / KR-200) TaxID=937777 RepID=K9ZZZ2_DEIPD|nr:alpha/beta hydrolase [Deinococcus peraridilitoris]AFZ67198.1 hypothetical protein Deipe_1665 [Deinococcus peraridilitoris DSM 19664]
MKKKLGLAIISLTTLVLLAFHARAATEQVLSLKTTSGDQEGTLILPTSAAGAVPVALILSGFGDWDRDGNFPGGAIGSNHYKLLAEGMAQQGIASLRFEKRGVNPDPTKRTPPTSFDQYADDARAWLATLKGDSRFSKIVVIGHGEGVLVGSIAAQQVPVVGLVSIDGRGRNMYDTALADLDARPNSVARETEKGIVRSLKAGVTPTNVPTELTRLYGPNELAFMASWGKYDPVKELGKLKTQLLIIQGGQNPAVSIEDGQLLSSVNAGQNKFIPNMSLTLKDATQDQAGNKGPNFDRSAALSEPLVPYISSFVKSLP